MTDEEFAADLERQTDPDYLAERIQWCLTLLDLVHGKEQGSR
ncbi:hypothetical protein [Kitasatospora azatica]|nr:hypothetical protein [Kitasatospora azatica]